jgi:hypothetical protein
MTHAGLLHPTQEEARYRQPRRRAIAGSLREPSTSLASEAPARIKSSTSDWTTSTCIVVDSPSNLRAHWIQSDATDLATLAAWASSRVPIGSGGRA